MSVQYFYGFIGKNTNNSRVLSYLSAVTECTTGQTDESYCELYNYFIDKVYTYCESESLLLLS